MNLHRAFNLRIITPKILLLICFLAKNGLTYAQDDGTGRTDYSPYGLKYSNLEFSMNQLASHGDASQITYFDLNFVEGRMQHFMRNYLFMAIDKFPRFSKLNGEQILTVGYAQMATIGTTKIPHLYFKYTIFDNKNQNPIIKSLVITGSAEKVIAFYTDFWPTTLNFDRHKNKVAYNYLLQDKATISMDAHGSWYITVSNTSIKSLSEYYKRLNESINSLNNLSVSNQYTTRPIYFDDDTERRLRTGNNYNSIDMKMLFEHASEKIILPNNEIVTAHALLKIDTNGSIYKMIFYNSNSLGTIYRDSLRNCFLNKQTKPFTQGNRSFESYKNLSITFMPPGDTRIKFLDAGSLDGNPYITYEKIVDQNQYNPISSPYPVVSSKTYQNNFAPQISKSPIEIVDSIQKSKPHYNTSRIDDLYKIINSLPKPSNIKYFQCDLLVKIDADGAIFSIVPSNLSDNVSPSDIVKSISTLLIGKKVAPYMESGKYYPSYKSYSVMFWPPNIPKISMTEDETLFQ